jgi:hypothetical protein
MLGFKTGYRTPEYRADVRRIVSVDGEGKTANNRHAYTLLAACDDRGYRDYIEHDGSERPGELHGGARLDGSHFHADDMAPNHGLSTIRCLDFLLSIPDGKSDLVISFAFTYDVTKILQDLPFAALREFAELGVTSWNGYVIAGIPRKYFEIWHNGRHCKVWDSFSYWQMSFAKALESSPELFTEHQQSVIDNIKRMKAERANFDMISDDEIREYCFSECEYLSILYRDFLRHCEDMDLRPSRHSGPGALAESFFRNVHLKDYMPYGSHNAYLAGLPVDVAIHSYYGGRFETAVLGSVGDVIEYDIQSAYPAIAVDLPCLKHGQFMRAKEFVPGRWGFYFVGSRTSGPWAPFPFRASADTGYLLNGASKGSIAFVHGGRRWVTSSEVETAIRHFGSEAIPVYSGWVFIPGCNHKPFDQVRELYIRRKIGNPKPSAGLSKVIKLIINSVYGKLAQSIGWKFIGTSQSGVNSPASYKPPEYQCYIWAALITGGTRAKVLDAALLGGGSVVSIATDGILTTRDIPELPVTDWELGTWERTPKEDCWLGMPGIYAFGRTPDDKKFKRRGLDAKYFPAHHLREAWERGEWKVRAIGNPDCPECVSLRHACPDHPPRAFMPLKLAITRVNALDVLGEWIPAEKTVKFLSVQHKRNLPGNVDPFMPHDGSPIRLEPITIPDDVWSAPYEPKQSWEDIARGRPDDPDIAMWDDSEDVPEYHEREIQYA